MTEEDTIRRLKRLPYQKVKIFEWMLDIPPSSRSQFNRELVEDLLYEAGWTSKEYDDEYNRRKALNV